MAKKILSLITKVLFNKNKPKNFIEIEILEEICSCCSFGVITCPKSLPEYHPLGATMHDSENIITIN